MLDLRYNGGGLVSVGRTVASYVAGSAPTASSYARCCTTTSSAASNRPPSATPLPRRLACRVYVLTGERTCSASEQVINGLRAVVDVVSVGDTTCGKPVGFLPVDDCWDTTYSVVNFECANALQPGPLLRRPRADLPGGRGLLAPLGDRRDPLLLAARTTPTRARVRSQPRASLRSRGPPPRASATTAPMAARRRA